ncbi:MAG TPA: efflux RND transporter permease subunit [Capsulimonadaceae bacterium]|nr:efflux RND transporter permease subunit [Capsulimonadaceae bacterium]
MRLSLFVWHHRKAALLIIVVLCLIGVYFSNHLPVAIFPNLTVPRIIVTADVGDAPIPTVLANVTRPLENAVAGIPGVARIRSITERGTDELDVNFTWGTDMPATLQKVQAALTQIQGNLPTGTQVHAEQLNPSVFPIMIGGLYSDRESMEAVRHIALYTIRPRLLRVPGVQQIMIQGGDTPDYLVQVNPTTLMTCGVSIAQIQDALSKTNQISAVGYYDKSYLRYDVLVSGLLKGPTDIENVTVAVKNRVPIKIGDIATVTRSIEKRTIETTASGHDAVLINVIKQPSANTVQVSDGVKATMSAMHAALPSDVQFSFSYDQSQIVLESQSSVIEAIVIGGILALFVLMLFLGNLRSAAVVLLILPITVLITFGLMQALGQTMNIMTLGALAIALGLVIDDGIVVVENIFHELEGGKTRRDAIAAGLHAITPAMVGSSITTICAFLPLTFLSGVTGEFFGPLALVMISMLLVSLVLALLLTPILAEYLLPTTAHAARGRIAGLLEFFPRIFTRVVRGYERLLSWSLRHRAVILIILVPIIGLTYFLYGHLQTGFFPEFDEGNFILDYQLPAGTSLAETNDVCKKIEAVLAQIPEVASWSRRTGTQMGFDITPLNVGDFSVQLKSQRSRDIQEVMDDVRDRVDATVPAAQVDFSQFLQDNIGDIAGSPQPVEVKIFGPDMDKLEDLANQVDEIVAKTPGVVDDFNGIVGSDPEVHLAVNTRKAQQYGLTADDISQAASAAMQGTEPTAIQEGEEPVGVRVMLAHPPGGLSENMLPYIPIASPVTNGLIPLSYVANIQVQPGTPQITREDQRQMISVTAGLSGRDLGSAVRDIQSRIARKVTLPQGYNVEYGGLYASQQESFSQLATVLVLAVLFVFTLLVIQFRSFRQSIALFLAAILSLSGVMLGLFITRIPLNISSYTGAILIVGIVTENGIVLFDFFNQLRKKEPDRPIVELMVESGRMRLRPILMTTIGAILALFPLALGIGAGAAMQKPLAVAVIGGLCVSTFFTLVVAPVLFVTMEGAKPGRLAQVEADYEEVEKELAR